MTNRSFALALTLAASCSALLGFSACSDDATVTPPGPDAAADATNDAAIEVSTSDAGDGAAIDAGPSATLTVLVEKRNVTPAVPVVGADVVFYDTNGDVVSKKTGNDGKASASMHAGASITVVRSNEYADFAEIMSVLDVGLGETIAVTDEALGLAPEAQLALTADAPPLGAGVEYRFYSGQGSSGGATVPSSYATQTSYPLVDGTGFRFLGFAPASIAPTITPTKYAACVATKNADGGVTPCNVAAGSWGDVTAGPLALVGTPPPAATRWLWDLGQANGLGLYPMIQIDVAPGSAALPPSYSRVPTLAAAYVQLEGRLMFPKGRSAHLRRLANTGTITEDFASYLPQLTAATVTGSLDAPGVAFTSASALSYPLIGYHRLSGTAPIEGGTRQTDWLIVHRATSATVTAPKLPLPLQSILPLAWKASGVSLFDSPQLPWETVRTLPRAQQRRTASWRWSYPQTAFDARYTTFN